jgi:hypothetical protein
VSASGFIYFEQTIPETLRRKKKQAGKQEKAEHFKAFSWETVTGTEFEDTTELSKASQPMEWSQPWNQEIGDLAKIRADCSGGKGQHHPQPARECQPLNGVDSDCQRNWAP